MYDEDPANNNELIDADKEIPAQAYCDLASKLYIHRRWRNNSFSADLFFDPVWDMLLALYIAHCRGEKMSVNSVVLASKTPATTGLRWLILMVSRGLAVRSPHPNDPRSELVQLTEMGADKMERYFKCLILEQENKAG